MLFIICIIGIGAGLFIALRSQQKGSMRLIGGIAALGFAVLAIMQIVVVVPAGTVAVVDVFGEVSDGTLKPGINIVNPFATIAQFSVKTQEDKETAEVPSKEGLSVGLETSFIFHLDPEKAAQIYKTVGQDYQEILLTPQARSAVRGVTAEYEAKALYTSEREKLAQEILRELSKRVNPRGIIIESVLLRKVSLPKKVTDAIEEKLRADQESQRMEFVLTKEKQEAERKRIEARGIADFQTIVNEGLNENALRWKGIQATERLASSPNTKVVVIGGKNGMPLILNGE